MEDWQNWTDSFKVWQHVQYELLYFIIIIIVSRLFGHYTIAINCNVIVNWIYHNANQNTNHPEVVVNCL